eukprot:TRINITY_DN38076_c0_g1_i1.p1 TRINITY_DN38076_c0_g1~~TRINITY_DN38076_c0_g1_i1.p1  ORF type:complete len:1135 (-),score=187.11 TRINITY_DN38076_c0_g1_i1:130-3534(-)
MAPAGVEEASSEASPAGASSSSSSGKEPRPGPGGGSSSSQRLVGRWQAPLPGTSAAAARAGARSGLATDQASALRRGTRPGTERRSLGSRQGQPLRKHTSDSPEIWQPHLPPTQTMRLLPGGAPGVPLDGSLLLGSEPLNGRPGDRIAVHAAELPQSRRADVRKEVRSGELEVQRIISGMDEEVEKVAPTKERYFETVKACVEKTTGLDGARIEMVGSTSWGGAVPQSDLDLVLLTRTGDADGQVGSDGHAKAVAVLRTLKESLDAAAEAAQAAGGKARRLWCSMALLEAPRVPILRLHDVSGLSCDVSVDQPHCLRHRDALKHALAGSAAIRDLIRLVKFWLRRRGLPMAAEGGLPSLAWSTVALRLSEQRPNESVPALLRHFFSEMRQLDAYTVSVEHRNARGVSASSPSSWAKFRWQRRHANSAWSSEWTSLLSVDDPSPAVNGHRAGITPPSIPTAVAALYVAELRLAWKVVDEGKWEELWQPVPAEVRVSLPLAIDSKGRQAPFHIFMKEGVMHVGQVLKVRPCPTLEKDDFHVLHRRDQSSELVVWPGELAKDGDRSDAVTLTMPAESSSPRESSGRAVFCQPCHWVCGLSMWGSKVIPGAGLDRLQEIRSLLSKPSRSSSSNGPTALSTTSALWRPTVMVPVPVPLQVEANRSHMHDPLRPPQATAQICLVPASQIMMIPTQVWNQPAPPPPLGPLGFLAPQGMPMPGPPGGDQQGQWQRCPDAWGRMRQHADWDMNRGRRTDPEFEAKRRENDFAEWAAVRQSAASTSSSSSTKARENKAPTKAVLLEKCPPAWRAPSDESTCASVSGLDDPDDLDDDRGGGAESRSHGGGASGSSLRSRSATAASKRQAATPELPKSPEDRESLAPETPTASSVDGPVPVGRVLAAGRPLREIDHLCSAPTPDFERATTPPARIRTVCEDNVAEGREDAESEAPVPPEATTGMRPPCRRRAGSPGGQSTPEATTIDHEKGHNEESASSSGDEATQSRQVARDSERPLDDEDEDGSKVDLDISQFKIPKGGRWADVQEDDLLPDSLAVEVSGSVERAGSARRGVPYDAESHVASNLKKFGRGRRVTAVKAADGRACACRAGSLSSWGLVLAMNLDAPRWTQTLDAAHLSACEGDCP